MCASSVPIGSMTASMQGRSERGGVTVRPLRTADDHHAALMEIASLMSAEADTPEGDRLDVLSVWSKPGRLGMCRSKRLIRSPPSFS